MKTIRSSLLAGALAAAFAASSAMAGATQTAVFAGGCFWSMQHGMEDVPGVVKVVAGYTGGRTPHPSYEEVSSETTGHYESVLVTYDPARISYAQLVDRYFHLTDPTDGTGQFCDHGPSYRPAIFVADAAQRQAATAEKAKVAGELRGRPIATAILPAQTFWPAEGYHQDYARKNAAAYMAYRIGCGRDASLRAVWRR
ncbi:MAG: peptide-methionine (S)-S-oxide reductase MsrA [Caulobacterales bacterium]